MSYMQEYWNGGDNDARASQLLEEAASLLGGRLITSTVVSSTGVKMKKRFVIEYECPSDN